MNNKCPFCLEIENRNDNFLKKNRVIAETNNLIVFPTIGGFVDNYQLIVPKKHLNCFGELNKEELIQLRSLIKWQQFINSEYFESSTLMFEHGSLFNNDVSGKSINHAHFHILPSNKSLINQIKEYGYDIIKIEDINSLGEICLSVSNYLYYHDINNQDYVIIPNGIPSQFLRKVLAKELNIDMWNWREYPFIERIEKNIEFYNKHHEFKYVKNKN